MLKSDALSLFRNASDMASNLGVTRSAVSQWPNNGHIPEAAYLKIRYVLHPQAFSANGEFIGLPDKNPKPPAHQEAA